MNIFNINILNIYNYVQVSNIKFIDLSFENMEYFNIIIFVIKIQILNIVKPRHLVDY